jgi:hypothetical protein
MPLRLPDTAGVAAAHGNFADLLAADRLRIRGHSALDAAVRAAQARRLAGGTAVDRFAGTDMAPLMAAEMAVWALGLQDQSESGPGVWMISDMTPEEELQARLEHQTRQAGLAQDPSWPPRIS